MSQPFQRGGPLRLALLVVTIHAALGGLVLASPSPTGPEEERGPAPDVEPIGVSQTGVLYDLDLTAAVLPPRADTGIGWIVDILSDGRRDLLALTTFASDPPNALVRIDPDTGAWTLVGETGIDVFGGDLALEPGTGRLLALYHLDSGEDEVHLLEIDRGTGAASSLATFSSEAIGSPSGMAFSADGTLYVIDRLSDELLTVDPDEAMILDEVTLTEFLGSGVGMERHPVTGTLYVVDGATGGTDRIYTLDPDTGGLSEVGPQGPIFGLLGITFYQPPLFAGDFETGDLSRWSSSSP